MKMALTYIACALALGVGFAVSHSLPTAAQEKQNFADGASGSDTIRGISRNKAIEIANEDARPKYPNFRSYKVVPCEQVRFWRIMYDGGGPEYVVDKVNATVVRRQVIPLRPSNVPVNDLSKAKPSISRDEAISIARGDAASKYGPKGEDVNQFAVFTCELAKSWRVVFDLQLAKGMTSGDLPNASFPKYVVDKKSGKILYRELN